MQCTVAVYDTEEIWWLDLNVEICREYLNSYPAPALGRAKKLTGVMWQKNVAHCLAHTQTHTFLMTDKENRKLKRKCEKIDMF